MSAISVFEWNLTWTSRVIHRLFLELHGRKKRNIGKYAFGPLCTKNHCKVNGQKQQIKLFQIVRMMPMGCLFCVYCAQRRRHHVIEMYLSNVRIGSSRASIGTNENEPRLSSNAHEVQSTKMASVCEDHSSRILLTGVYEVFDANYTSEKTGENPLESLLEVNGRSRKSKSRCSSEAKRQVKITSRFRHGGFRLVRFVLQSRSIYSPFFMARFGIRELCACFSQCSFAFRICIVYHSRESIAVQVYAMETPRELSKCIRTVRKIEQLLCRSANLSFRLCICLLSTLKAVWIKWKLSKPARRFCLRLAHVQINSRADYFNSVQ